MLVRVQHPESASLAGLASVVRDLNEYCRDFSPSSVYSQESVLDDIILS